MVRAIPRLTLGAIIASAAVVVTVALRRRWVCPHCPIRTAARHNTRPVLSSWRHLDLGRWRLTVQCRLRRLACPGPWGADPAEAWGADDSAEAPGAGTRAGGRSNADAGGRGRRCHL